MDERTVFSILVGISLAALVAVPVALRRRRQRRDELALAGNVARGLGVPASLHPVIDADRCIGSLACLKACPEGDILGIIDGAARLVHGTNCVGHGRCAAACPVNAITLVFGSSARGVDLPEVDGRFESSRPGVHLVGELAGMGLIGNAVEQGVLCARYLAEELAGRPGTGERCADLVVIGAGPAGIACALEARARGLAVRLLDRGRLGGAMASYPRQGLVMAGPLELPGVGALRQPRIGKLELIAWFEAALSAAGLRVDEGVQVTGLSGRDGDFTVETGVGPLAARKVVLATGRGGAPRRLGVPGEELTKVTQALADVEQYAGARVLVVGGGDVAVDAACALVGQAGTEVTLVHRGAALDRCRQENRDRALRLAGQGRLALRLGTEVQQIDESYVTLRTGGALHLLANHYVIACLGGETAWPFLSRMGVELRRPVAASSGDPAVPASPEQASRRRWQRGLRWPAPPP